MKIINKSLLIVKATLIAAAVILMTAGACTHHDEEDIFEEINYESKSIASSEKCTYPTVFTGTIPVTVKDALSVRFTNISSEITSNTQIVIIPMNNLSNVDINSLTEVYDNGGIIVIIRPDFTALSSWADQHEFRLALCVPEQNGAGNTTELYAFTKNNNHYVLDFVPEDEEYNEFLNPFVSWMNEFFSPPVQQNADPKDVRNLFDYQTIDYTFSVALKKQECKVLLSTPDSIEKNGTINVKVIIYPLYAFQDQAAPGDYYIVSMTVTAHNDNMYRGKWVNTHGKVKVRLCGYYMEKLRTETRLLNTNYTAVSNAVFAYNGTPVPLTTIGASTYTSGFSWSLGGSVTGGVDGTGPNLSATVNAGVTFSNSTSRTISDVEIRNNSAGSTVSYNYPFKNLPYYQALKISDPPAIAVSNAEFRQDWIWRIPNTNDYGTERYILETAIYPEYGSCHFYSSVVDMNWNTWTDAVQGYNYFRWFIFPPYRIPTGELNILNSMSGQYFTDIQIWKSATSTSNPPDYVISGSFAPNQTATKILPIGMYKIQLKIGPNAASATPHHLITPITITRGEAQNLNSGFDFIEGGY